MTTELDAALAKALIQRAKDKRKAANRKVSRKRAVRWLNEWAAYSTGAVGLVKMRSYQDQAETPNDPKPYDDPMTDYLSMIFRVQAWYDALPLIHREVIRLEFVDYHPDRARWWAAKFQRKEATFASRLSKLKDSLAVALV